MQQISCSCRKAVSSCRLLVLAVYLLLSADKSFQLSPAQIEANSALVQGAQNGEFTLTCLTSSSTEYATRLAMATAMNISWVKTKDFSAIYSVDEEENVASLKNSSYHNVLQLFNLQLSDQYYYICGIQYSNGTFELYNSFNLFVTVTPQMHLIINDVLLDGIDAIVTRMGKTLVVACTAIDSNPSVYLTAVNLNHASYLATSENVTSYYETTINKEEYDDSTELYTNTIQFSLTIDSSNADMGSLLCVTTSKKAGITLTVYTKVDIKVNDSITTTTTTTSTTSRKNGSSVAHCNFDELLYLLVLYFCLVFL